MAKSIDDLLKIDGVAAAGEFTLDGKLVTLKNLGASAFRDRGLQLTAKEIAHLPGSPGPGGGAIPGCGAGGARPRDR